eukprot:4186579-Heterocapsa_arctica.AAC.1
MHPDRARCTPQPEKGRSGLFVVYGRRPRPAACHHPAPPGCHQKLVRQPRHTPGDLLMRPPSKGGSPRGLADARYATRRRRLRGH